MTTKPKRRIMRAFKLHEISAVDVPAQQHARAAISKRSSIAKLGGVDFSKTTMLTTATLGHTHLLNDYDGMRSGETTYASIADTADRYTGHSHPWVRNDDGTIVIGESAGHTHTLTTAEPAASGEPEPVEKKEPIMAEKTDNEKRLENELALAKAYGALTDEQKTHHDSLADIEKAAFIAMTPAARAAEIAKKHELDPVVYKCTDGTEIRKSAGTLLLKMAQQNDHLAKTIAMRDAQLEHEHLEKSAGSILKNYPKTAIVKVAVLKALNSIPDEAIRKEAIEMVTAGNTALAGTFETIGEAGTGTAIQSADDQLESMAKKHAAENKIDFGKAYVAVLNTPEGRELYASRKTLPSGS